MDRRQHADVLDALMTIEEAARYLGVSKASLRRWTNDGHLECVRVGVRGERRFRRRSLDAHLADRSGAEAAIGRPDTSAPRDRARPADPDALVAGAADPGTVAHVSLFFREEAELWALVRPYLRAHLDANLPILYTCDTIRRQAFRERLRADGIEPEPLETAGLLRLLEADESYLRTGSFEAEAMLAFMEAAILDCRSRGFDRLMLSGEMAWGLRGAPGSEQLFAYEAGLNELMARYPGVTTVCSYDLRRFSGQQIIDSLRSHPYAQLSDGLVEGMFEAAAH